MTVECVIPQTDHRTVMGSGGNNVREITRQYDVGIKFPDRPVANGGESLSQFCFFFPSELQLVSLKSISLLVI